MPFLSKLKIQELLEKGGQIRNYGTWVVVDGVCPHGPTGYCRAGAMHPRSFKKMEDSGKLRKVGFEGHCIFYKLKSKEGSA